MSEPQKKTSARNHRDESDVPSRWPSRFAWAIALVTFPLIWAGGLVTSTDAGMAVPDWPGTYGYNMFLYPINSWFFGPWDLFIEHGHRLLGSLAGLMAIGFVIAAFLGDRRKWLRIAAVLALLLVIAQGTLGGVRVLADDRQIAKLHGCVGPAFFAFSVALIFFTSRFWRNAGSIVAGTLGTGQIRRSRLATVAVALLAWVQLIIGANLRHVDVEASHSTFNMFVMFHLLLAVVVAGLICFNALRFSGKTYRELQVGRVSKLLGLLVLCQVALGCGTWIVQYGWPGGAGEGTQFAGYTILSRGFMQTSITTAHVAIGSLIVGLATHVACKTWRVTHFSIRAGSANAASSEASESEPGLQEIVTV